MTIGSESGPGTGEQSTTERRLLFCINTMQAGGAQRVAATLVNYLTNHGIKVTLLATYSGRSGCDYALDENVDVEYLADRINGKGAGILGGLKRVKALRKYIRERKPCTIVSFLTSVNVLVLLASVGMRTRVFVSERTCPSEAPVGLPVSLLRRLTYRLSSAVIVQNEQIGDWIRLNCPGTNTTVLPNPIGKDLTTTEERICPKQWLGTNNKLILSAGRLCSEKQYDLLLDAFWRLSGDREKWTLVILGEGPVREQLEKKIAELGLENRAHLPGRAGNIEEWYAIADIFVLSSRFEGFPNALVEALANGVPAVSFDCNTGPRELIVDGVTGLLVPPERGVEGLVEGIRTVMDNERLRRDMGERARRVGDVYSLENVGRRWIDTLDAA